MELIFEHIKKKYKAKTALDDVSIKLSEGVHALLGPNGAGKSTLMNILAGLLKPTNGVIMLDGIDVLKMGANFRNILGYLPQNPGFYPNFSAYDLMKYFSELKKVPNAKSKIDELLNFLNLSEDSNRKYGEYSGGMKRRLGIAVSLLNDPKILILDEPTAGLDPKERMRFRNIISQIGRNKIIILATHIVPDIETIADNVILLKSGKVVFFGNTSKAVDSVNGKVWNVSSDIQNAENYVLQHQNSTIIKSGDSVYLHIVHEKKPLENAVNVSPTLEDVYMYWFEESSTKDEE